MAVGDGLGSILSSAGIDASGFGSGFGSFITGLSLFIIVSTVCGLSLFLLYSRKSYKNHIHIFKEVNGRAFPAGEDLAREIALPNTSTRAYWLKKHKMFIPRPSIETGLNHHWYFIRKDGEWLNIGLTNLNAELTELGISYDHTDMRMSNASLKKLVEKNYKKLNWIKEYMPYIAMGILILLLGITGWLLINEARDVSSGLASAVKTNAEVMGSVENILKSLDNLCSSSGVRTIS